jgi:uncharacterized Tic20 family protein
LRGGSKRKERREYATEKTRLRFAGEILFYIIAIGPLVIWLVSFSIRMADELVARNVIPADWSLIVVAILLLIPMIATVVAHDQRIGHVADMMMTIADGRITESMSGKEFMTNVIEVQDRIDGGTR